MTAALNVLIASPLEAEHADRIASADSRINLLYEPDLLPVPRYPSDHGGTARDLDEASLANWSQLRAAAEVSFDFDWQAPAQIPQNSPRLRWIQGTSAGIGGMLDRTGLVKSPIVFTTAAGVHGVPLAEFTLLGLLHFAKGMARLARDQAERRWQLHTTTQLRGSRVLLVGLGGVGREVARSLAAVGVEVVGAGLPGKTYDLQGVREYVADSEIGDVLATVDALVLACPLTARTRHLIGERELALMRPGAVIVNVARGAVIDESALIDALTAGHLGGACLDVFEIEPLPASSPLWAMDNVIISPHSASTVADENRLLTDLFIENIGRWLAGEPLRNVFDKDAGY
ncbi:MAG TPA: D-2-hydroxyacid dehydrogenase [Streptosporangiaceae bacterium]|jgi:phosphoglycerate dehydrogenase-like enzyme|nr:D-2-hydroxyacid dehydrogenase [Streptosporangiaceae bacterium]